MTAPKGRSIPRLRMFAGPNGSGKSTIKDTIQLENDIWLGVNVNPDDIEAAMNREGMLDLTEYGVTASSESLRSFFKRSTLIRKQKLVQKAENLYVIDNCVQFNDVPLNSYVASVLADFIRHELLRTGTSFSFETVMSHPDKIGFLSKARAAGFRTYLYFITTKDPIINASRVETRVASGGHDVPARKIKERFKRSMNLLIDAVRQCDRAYLFDNSGESAVLVAEVDEGNLTIKNNEIPSWLKEYFLDKLA